MEYVRNLDSRVSLPMTNQVVDREFHGVLEGRDNSFVMLMMRLHDDDAPIGWVALDGIQWQHGTAMIAIGIGDAKHRGQGYGEEAMRLFIDFAFNEMNLYRIGLTVFEYNMRGVKLYERLGFVLEGTLREFMIRDGRRWDMHHYGLLRSDWKG
jgi:hypothetical protein